MSSYLLDTNILSDLIHHTEGPVAARIRMVGERNIFTSIVVACELRFGVAKKNAPRLAQRVATVLAQIDVQPFATPADEAYAKLRWHLERTGQPIGANDMLMAAQCLVAEATLVTANVREFERVPGLRIENWLA